MSQMPYDSNAMPWDERNALAHAQPCTSLHIDTSQATELSGEIVGARTLKTETRQSTLKPTYPRLMATIGWQQIILLTEASVGTVVHDAESERAIGLHTRTWKMSDLIPFTGEVLLSN